MTELEILQIVLLVIAGLGAGLINTIVGSGSLITFPALLALGYSPVLANVTNNVGVLPGSISGAIGYRRELRGDWRSVLPLAAAACAGGAAGALLLLVLPPEIFDGAVPLLIALACVLVIFGPTLKRRLAMTQDSYGVFRENRTGLSTATALTGVYGGYFGAAQGVILLAILSIMLKGSMQRANAVKNVLAAASNSAAAVVFLVLTPVDWFAAGVIAFGAVLGGQIGAKIGRRIPELALRITIVAVGIVAIVALLIT